MSRIAWFVWWYLEGPSGALLVEEGPEDGQGDEE